MKNVFEMNGLEKMSYFLGIEIMQSAQGFFLCQMKYLNEVLVKFGMKNYKAISTFLVPSEKQFR